MIYSLENNKSDPVIKLDQFYIVMNFVNNFEKLN